MCTRSYPDSSELLEVWHATCRSEEAAGQSAANASAAAVATTSASIAVPAAVLAAAVVLPLKALVVEALVPAHEGAGPAAITAAEALPRAEASASWGPKPAEGQMGVCAAMEMDRLQVTDLTGGAVWIHRIIIGGAAGSVRVMLVASELHHKLLPAPSCSTLLKRVRNMPGCGLASAEQLSMLKRKGVISNRALSAFLVTADAARVMFNTRPQLKEILDTITMTPPATDR